MSELSAYLTDATAKGAVLLVSGAPVSADLAIAAPWGFQVQWPSGEIANICGECGNVLNRFTPGVPRGMTVRDPDHDRKCDVRELTVRDGSDTSENQADVTEYLQSKKPVSGSASV